MQIECLVSLLYTCAIYAASHIFEENNIKSVYAARLDKEVWFVILLYPAIRL